MLFLLAAAGLVLGLHCQPKADENQHNGVQAGSEDLAPVLGEVPPFTLTDQMGNTFGSDELRGKVWIATFIFTRSRETTPQQIAQMAELQKHLETQPVWSGIRLISITAEPERDTPDVLRTFAQQAGADTTHWKFLTGPRDEIWELCKQGFNLPVREEARTAQRPITHSPKFVLVDRKNRIRGYYDGLTLDGLNELILSLDFVLPERPEPERAGAAADQTTPERTQLVLPPENIDLPWLESRRAAQRASADAFEVFYDFRFDDRLEESGIRFRHKIVNNAGKDWIPNHYDHGNGVAIADVDGDGLHDLYFTTQVGSNELWRNLGGGAFENITQAAGGLGLEDHISVTASFADIDNDGDSDLYVTTVRGGNVLFENDGTGAFSDISAASGLDYNGHSSAAVFFDYNRDGLLDLFLVNVGIYTRDTVLPVTNGTSPEQEDGRFQFYEGNEDAFIAHLYPERAERSIL
ncbi:MAG: SCO family protein, partial [Rhodothermales bacterium]